jgi:hypothetical protein
MGSYGDYWDYRYTSLIKKGSLIEYVRNTESQWQQTARALGMVLGVHWNSKWSHTTIELVCQTGQTIRIRIWQVYWIHKI